MTSSGIQPGLHAHDVAIVDVAIVGAGAAGLAAAAILRAAGRSCILFEASGRIGGRAHTIRPKRLGGARFDTGASWLHQTGRNPLVQLARARGIPLVRAHQGEHRLFVGRPAEPHESQEYDAAYAAWERVVEQRAGGSDISLAEARGPPGRWTANIENWEATIIAAADADTLSLHDWQRNLLDEGDLSPPDGIGTLLADLLGPMAGTVRFETRVEAIDWRGADLCRLRTTNGPVDARAIIVTVSTGVLRAGSIAFDPPLPPTTRGAIDGLPMGLLSKLAMPATGTGRLGLEAETLLERQLDQPSTAGITSAAGITGAAGVTGGMMLSAWPSDLPYVSGFFGGRYARSLADRPADALADAHAMLCSLLGADAGLAVDASAGIVTDWETDPLFRGAYAYCPPGQAHQRGRLAEPLGDGRLLFAGEACRTDGLAGTVGGALADGERAARHVLRYRFGMETAPHLGQIPAGLADGVPPIPKA